MLWKFIPFNKSNFFKFNKNVSTPFVAIKKIELYVMSCSVSIKKQKTPIFIRKIRGRPCFSVKKRGNKTGRRTRFFSRCTTMRNATRQRRLLSAIIYNPRFVRRQGQPKGSPSSR